jgi:Asp-tRNA(Asn)/Glu-tRNA(Gln) amidotransferase A subunit family amidase
MNERERWIVYPLLFFALGAALRDKFLQRVTTDELVAKRIVCDELDVRDPAKDGRIVARLTSGSPPGQAGQNADRFGVLVLFDSEGRELCGVTILEAEAAANLAGEYEHGAAQLSAGLRAQLERGRAVTAFDHQSAVARIPLLNAGFAEIFERCDAILTPAAAGTAPRGLESTGDPAFCTLWTLCGMPALSLPLMQGADGLPLGVQLVGGRHNDARLLRTARWLLRHVAAG